MNLDKERIRVEWEPFDFRFRPMGSVRQLLMNKGAEVRRSFRLWKEKELRFVEVLAPGASLEMGMGFYEAPEDIGDRSWMFRSCNRCSHGGRKYGGTPRLRGTKVLSDPMRCLF